jgi:asparagine synthase (glutamine-hydrolysing)
VGIVHQDGLLVPIELIRRLTEFMSFRGPDGMDVWSSGSIGLGHSLLRTGENSTVQLAQIHDLHITADVHLDSASVLRKELQDAGRQIDLSTPDPILILHAYAAWGQDCVQHLRGDFAFGIWDATTKSLFCARDHFGIKPFYYAAVGEILIFSNTLECLRQHPAITSELNELAVGDFLLFGLNYNKATTTFRDIQRLPPAHFLLLSGNTLRTRCYWEPPVEERLRYQRPQEYLDRFEELLQAAVSDRLVPGRVGILLSGGLDSAAVAVAAKDFSSRHQGVPELLSYTVGYDSLIPDEEGSYARRLANFLALPNRYLSLDDVELFDEWDNPDSRSPEPIDNPLSAGSLQLFRMIASDCRVALSGEGADNLMFFQMWPYIKDLQRQGNWRRLIVETAWFLCVRPFPWLGLARRTQSLFERSAGRTGLPEWIAPEFARRVGLAERWNECSNLEPPARRHLARPRAHASMLFPQWTTLFEQQNPGVTRCPVEVRYPFLDLRMVEFLLALPVFPWLYKKRLTRTALAGRIPDEIRHRPKTPLRANPVVNKLQKYQSQSRNERVLVGQIERFVNPSMLGSFRVRMTPEQLRPFYLDTWLKGIR